MKSALPSKRVSAHGKKMHCAIVWKQLERDQRMQRIHDDLELAIEDGDKDVDMVEKPPPVMLSGLRQHVSKPGYVICKDCEEEKERGDGSGLHFCANGVVIVGFRTKVSPIACRSAGKSGLDPGAGNEPVKYRGIGG